MFFHKYGGSNVVVTNSLLQFSMFVPTKANVKLSNGKMGHAQVIGIILCFYPNFPVVYPLGPVYYCPGQP